MPALKGAGLVKGLGVTFRTMSRRAATQQYPHVRPNLPARSRGVIALLEENCTVCMLCSRECPDWCIYIDSHKETVAPKEVESARKAADQLRAKAATAAEAQAKAAAEAPAAAAAAPAAPAAAAPEAEAEAEAAPAAAPAQQDVHVEPGIDQETFDRLVAAGEPERTARAKAKASYMRKAKAAARAAQAGDGEQGK